MRLARLVPLLLGLGLTVPAPASALEVSFSNAGDADLVSAIDSSPVTLELVRGDKVLVAAGPRRTARVGRPLQAGDVARVTLAGGEVRTFTWEGLPTLDADPCASLGQQTLTGSFPAGATVSGSVGEDGVGLTLDGSRFTAQLPRPLMAGEYFSMEARRTEGGALVRYQLFVEVCPSAVPPPPPVDRVELDLPGKKLRKVPVDRRGRFELRTRAQCPPELPSCRVFVDVFALTRRGKVGRLLGRAQYSVPGGTSRRVHGKLRRHALAALRRTGRRVVSFSVVIRKPEPLPEGITALGPDLHTAWDGTLFAP